ncbi:MAG TPA: M23 family metallopeptidase [Marmoricola sp.]|nr:M23 family metallopeptidase [Marmoricola sp.]
MSAVVALITVVLSVWPLVPRPEVVTAFDPPSAPWGAGHRGVDLLGRPGEVVRAAAAGRIVFAARLAGRGVVVVDHGSVRTTYEPVAATVHVGQQVAEGQPLGRLQAASSHCFPRACLHWGLLRGDTYLDPLTLVGAGPVRLLPWRADGGPAGWFARPVLPLP